MATKGATDVGRVFPRDIYRAAFALKMAHATPTVKA